MNPAHDIKTRPFGGHRVCSRCLSKGRPANHSIEKFPSHGLVTGRWCWTCVAEAKNATDTPSATRCDSFQDLLIGDTLVMRELYSTIERVGPLPITVLLQGETGTGKELVARGLHRISPRQPKPFIPINCAALPDTLLESALFGHRKGAFTGADRDHKGYFDAAAGGTIFLDEIGDMPLPLQAKLLRVLQDGEVTPLGDTQPRHIDVRIIAATNRDLWNDVTEKRFRSDLYFRLAVMQVDIPPLRDRQLDVPLLAMRFLRTVEQRWNRPKHVLSDDALQRLVTYGWPGNVRELRNEMERCVALDPPDQIITWEQLSNRLRA